MKGQTLIRAVCFSFAAGIVLEALLAPGGDPIRTVIVCTIVIALVFIGLLGPELCRAIPRPPGYRNASEDEPERTPGYRP
jgi:hypothetical protein